MVDTVINGTAYYACGSIAETEIPISADPAFANCNLKTKIKNVLKTPWGRQLVSQTIRQGEYVTRFIVYKSIASLTCDDIMNNKCTIAIID